MGIFIDVNEEYSEIVVENILDILKARRDNEDKQIQKICNQCIKYLKDRDVNYEIAEKNIELLNKKAPDKDPFYLLLLGLLNESVDEEEQAIQYFTDILESEIVKDFREELADFIVFGKFYTLSDFTELENVGLILINKFSSEKDISNNLWQLSTRVNPLEYLQTFSNLIRRASELYPENYEIDHFNGYIYSQQLMYDKALESYLHVAERLKAEDENPNYNFDLAVIWDNIAYCYYKLGIADKTMECCDTALAYNEESEDFSLENNILRRKAEAFLLLKDKDSALSILNAMLEDNEEDPDTLALIEKIKSDENV
jgi:tetratricopeptide (TPR) repeat protein